MYFNSSMVRLKVDTELHVEPVFTLFQFQYGTIKGQYEHHLANWMISISIPVWYD